MDFPSGIYVSKAPPPFFPRVCSSSGFTMRSVIGSVVLDVSWVVVERVALLF